MSKAQKLISCIVAFLAIYTFCIYTTGKWAGEEETYTEGYIDGADHVSKTRKEIAESMQRMGFNGWCTYMRRFVEENPTHPNIIEYREALIFCFETLEYQSPT